MHSSLLPNMDPRYPQTRVFKSLLPKNGSKLLLNQVEGEPEFVYKRNDTRNGTKAKSRTYSNSAAAIQRRNSRKKTVIVDGVAMTNRDLERIRDREAKQFKRLLKTHQEELCSKKKEGTNAIETDEKTVAIPLVNALTDFSCKRDASGEY